MSTETLTQYRQTTDENNYVPQFQLVTKGEDGVTRVAKSNPETGALIVDTELNVNAQVTTEAALDILKTTIVGQRYNQIEISFQSAPAASLITNTLSGGGAVSYTGGHALYATGTAASASAKGVSVISTAYRAGHEVYAMFTAAFTTPTAASSYQRIGLFDAQNGFFLGYEGTTFGITKRTSGVDTFVAQTAFSDDKLDGSAGSTFTRGTAPEALNKTFSNLFRIRFAWLGSANIVFEVLSPDGKWVVFHQIKQPNLANLPSLATPNLPMSIDVSKTASNATNLIMYTACWAAGTTSALEKITSTLTDNSLAQLSRSVITGQTTGGGGGFVNVKVNPSGALTTEVTGSVSLTAGSAVIGKTGYRLIQASTSFTRPADTIAYTTGDAVTNSTSAPVVFQLDLGSLGAVVGQQIEVRKLSVISSVKGATLPLFNVFLSNVTFTATNDNSPLDITDAVMEADGSWFACDVQNSTLSNARCSYVNVPSPIVLAAADTKLYGTIQTAIAYTPASAEKFTIIAWIALL